MPNPRAIAKRMLLRTVEVLTSRHPVLLPQIASDEASTLDVTAPYRVEGPTLDIQIHNPGRGELTATLLTPNGANASRVHWRSKPIPFNGPAMLGFDLTSGQVRVGGQDCGHAPVPLPARRFSWALTIRDSGRERSRVTGHYLPGNGAVGDDYYAGGNYVDYEAESLTTRELVVALARQYPFRGVAVEIGCATGGLLEDLGRAGVDAIGVDYSAWAVGRARERVGQDRVWQVDVEKDELTETPLAARAPFGALIMLSVLEHFADPFGVLERVGRLVGPGGRLFLTTTNAGGVSRWLFGRDWEGYFDWTHRGVDAVSAESLKTHLDRLSWKIEQFGTSLVWDGNADPTHATLREWWVSDARFRRLLAERDLGDLITCVATKR